MTFESAFGGAMGGIVSTYVLLFSLLQLFRWMAGWRCRVVVDGRRSCGRGV